MSKYYCPYCSPKYVFDIPRMNGNITCGQCGEVLKKRPFIKPTQLFAFITAIAFITPFVFLIISSINNFIEKSPENFNNQIVKINSKT